MLIRPHPYPDELDEGYIGYVTHLNGLRSRKELDSMLREWNGCPDKSSREVPLLELISQVANLSVVNFVRQHTTLPLRRGITSYQSDLPHGSSCNREIWWTTAMRNARTGAFFCGTCVREDLDFHGRSYWRRSHQIPGLLACKKHETALSFCREHSAFHQPPSHWIDNSELVDCDWAKETMSNKTISRYLAICDGLMDSHRPFAVEHVRAVLFQKGTALGLQTSAGKVKAPLLSDRIIEQCGRPWLGLVLPDAATKVENTYLTKIDGVFFLKTSASTTFAYALACASLFDSAEEALNALAGPRPNSPQARQKKRVAIEPATLISTYSRAGGSHAKTAKELGVAVATASSRLTSLGLPNLVERAKSSTQKALSAFIDEGRSLQQSAEIGRISITELEDALRVMAAGAMKTISKPEVVRRKGPRRTGPLMPDIAKRIGEAEAIPAETRVDQGSPENE